VKVDNAFRQSFTNGQVGVRSKALSLRLLMRNFILFFILLLLFAGALTGTSGCANMLPPSGGPRDTIPPVLVKVSPPDSTRNFREKEVVFTFDEFVDVKDQLNNIIFTPTFEKNPEVSANLRTVRVKFNQTLEDSTTYVINFGNSIVDINESNVLRNFTYSFSTGPALDSLEIKGRVIMAEDGSIDSTLSVVLHRDLSDTAIKSKRPPYIVKLNGAGYFNFRYLPADTFKVYAVESGGGNMRTYTVPTQKFAFYDTTVFAGQADSLVLYAYVKTTKTNTPASGAPAIGPGTRGNTNDRRLRIVQTQGQQDLKTPYILEFPTALRSFDSTKVLLTSDSTYAPVVYSISLDSTRKKLQFSTKEQWKEDTRYNLILQKDFAADSGGRQLLKTDTLFFNTKKLADYGSVVIRFKNVDSSKNPVLQLVQNGAVVAAASIRGGVFSNPQFNPGEYSMRILYDANNNGKWDPGSFPSPRRQPEIVKPIERTITIKSNWDNEFDIVL